MNFSVCMTPKMRLHDLAVKALQEFDKSVDHASMKVFHLIVDDEDLLRELVSQHVKRVLDEDMNGGGIGLRPVTKTGGDAVADEKGHVDGDHQMATAPSSAPQSQTPAEKPVGGGHWPADAQTEIASPTSSGTARFTTVRQSPRSLPSAPMNAPKQTGVEAWAKSNIVAATRAEPKPKATYVAPKPRASAESRLWAKNLVAGSILDDVKVRGLAIGEWRKDDGLKLAESMGWDAKVLHAFCHGLPFPHSKVREHITVSEAEKIMKDLEANRAA